MTHTQKKLIPTNEATVFTDTRRQKKTWNTFPPFISEHKLSSSSKMSMLLRMLRFLSSFHQPKKQFHCQEGQSRATAEITSTKLLQITKVAVKGEEHLKNKQN